MSNEQTSRPQGGLPPSDNRVAFQVEVRGASFVDYPVERQLEADLSARGLNSNLEAFHLPPRAPPYPAMAMPFIDVAMGMALLIAGAMGQAILSHVCDTIVSKVLRPHLDRLLEALKREQKEKPWLSSVPITCTFGVWYETERVYIRVQVSAKTPQEARKIPDLILQAHENGLKWIREHGVTHPVMSYWVQDGQINSVPTLSEFIPDSDVLFKKAPYVDIRGDRTQIGEQ